MSLGVLNNIAAIYAQNNLNQTQSSLQKTLTELSSGSRINSGADDAAGLAVADGLAANESALTQSAQNASDGVGLLQTADGALAQVTNLLNRAVTLATEAANGTLNASQVNSANQEYQNILTEIGNIGASTNFNGNAVFSSTATGIFVSDGTSSGSTTFSETVGALTAGSVGLSVPTGTASSTSFSQVTAAGANAAPVSALALTTSTNTLGGSFTVAIGTGAAATYTITAGSSVSSAVAQLNAESGFSTGLTASVGTGSQAGDLVITGTQGASNGLTFSTTNLKQTTIPGNTPAAGVNFTSSASTDISTLTAANASSVLTGVTSAIADVAYQRGIIGADINQLDAASNVASAQQENLTSAESNIRSTNYGQATSDLAKYQVLSQTGISALAQANSVAQEVLKLLQS